VKELERAPPDSGLEKPSTKRGGGKGEGTIFGRAGSGLNSFWDKGEGRGGILYTVEIAHTGPFRANKLRPPRGGMAHKPLNCVGTKGGKGRRKGKRWSVVAACTIWQKVSSHLQRSSH